MKHKKLPIGIQTFREIREDDCYYVDKTRFALQLIEQGKAYFLSRPRRFGKSLFLDTLKELFEGNEILFEGLYAQTRWNWAVRYPVIRIDFASGVLRNREELDRRILTILRENRERLDLNCTEPDNPASCFAELLQRAHQKYGQRAVVLVDEYDKPILDNITERETAREMRDGLRNLYSVIKGSDAHVKFVFITGVSKFSKVSLFSGLNNLNDITIDTDYSAICGYTDKDIDTIFAPELEGLDREEIRTWYNGYNWTGEAVYNPFDLLLLLQKRQFRPWWFETGTATFLVDLLKERQQFLPDLENMSTLESLISRFDVDDLPTEALLFQTGYLTIDHVEWTGANQLYHLRYPNHEVRKGLTEQMLFALTSNTSATTANLFALHRLLKANDLNGLKALIQAFFASIPHDWYRNNPIAQYEGYYASVFYSYFAALGLNVIPEDVTNHGRIDLTVKFNGRIYLFEFKVAELVPEGRAMEQLKAKDYAAKYRASGQPIHLIGVEFSKETRNVVGFEVEDV